MGYEWIGKFGGDPVVRSDDRVVGSHHIFKHPTKPGHISVPHPKADLGKGLIHKLLKQAGLK